FQQAIELGAEHIDVNFGNPALAELLQQKKKTRIIVSYHNFSETPADVSNIHSALTATGADIIKIATYANSLQDSMRILDLLKISDRDMIAIAMGEKGEISRILAPLFGAYLTFASLAAGSESAPGQIPVETMKNIFRIHEINPGFHLYGIIGNPVNKSKGFRIHNRLFRHYGLNNLYLNFLVDDLPEFIEHIAPKLSGFSVTMPHKQAILKYLDEIDPLAHTIGAVNTVTNRDGILHGFNTDLTGALQPILKHTSIEGKQVTLLGAGGAARAIAVGILDQGGSLTILNRTVAKAKALARDLGCQAGPLADFSSRHTD
ncbi:MAG: type I 3-dehydroquinate dehydratase, partial [Deltaproteobacteria bacterium]|nr:type I 3-dehydroquinate dehydratase [Deltaproteobacteria bacterium]